MADNSGQRLPEDIEAERQYLEELKQKGNAAPGAVRIDPAELLDRSAEPEHTARWVSGSRAGRTSADAAAGQAASSAEEEKKALQILQQFETEGNVTPAPPVGGILFGMARWIDNVWSSLFGRRDTF